MKLWVVIRPYSKMPAGTYWREYDQGCCQIHLNRLGKVDSESPILVPKSEVLPWAVRLGDPLAFAVENGKAYLTK
jgi:hypothetical protein